MQTISELLAKDLNCRQEYVENVIALLDEGNTIPFIARYRKEQHGAMDDTTLRTLETRLQYLRNLAQRREEVKASIAAQEKLTAERKELSRRYLALKDEVKEAERIRKGVYAILREENRKEQPTHKQDLDR